jgi:hypothetical protein
MSYGKQSGGSTTTPINSPTQTGQVGTQSAFLQNNVMPAYAGLLGGATDLYNTTSGDVSGAAKNLYGAANQAQNVLGAGGQSAYTSGINALQSIASPEYQAAQMQAAMAPAQYQYGQNLAAQGAQFGGAGQLGSSRSALAQQQLAGLTQMQQQQAAAGVLNNIAQQQQAAGSTLGQLGQQGISGALSAGQAGLTAAQSPMAYLQQLGQTYAQIPQAIYNPSYAGLTGTSTSTSGKSTGISI